MGVLRKIIILICLLQFPYFIFSQEVQNKDSLTKLLASTKQDTTRIELYIKLSNNLEKEDSIQKFAYADSAIVLAENLKYIKYQASAKRNKAKLLQLYNKYTDAIVDYESAILLFKDIGNILEIADINFQLGDIYYRLNNFQKSLDFHKKALKQRQEIKDTAGIIKSESGVAVMHWRMGNLIDAEKHYNQSLELSTAVDNIPAIGSSLNSLGAIYWGIGNFNKAFENFEKALRISLKTGNNRKYVLIINNIGLIYQEWGKNDKAIDNYQEGLELAKKEEYPYGLAYSYSNIGKINLLKNENKKALLNFDSALINYVKISKKIGIAYSYRNIGDAYLGMKDLPEAIKYYKLSVKTAREVDSKQHLALALKSLAKVYFESENYNLARKVVNQSLHISTDQYYQDISKDNYFLLSKLDEKSGSQVTALLYYKKASALKDSIFNEKSSKQIAEMQTRYETEKKEQENITLRRDEQLKNAQLKANKVEIQNQYILIFAFATLLVLFIAFAFLLNKNRKNLLKSKKLLTKQNKEIFIQKEELVTQRENLKETNAELQKATDFKNKMFSIIGHDLRGPVGTIGSIISLAMDEQLEDHTRQKMLSITKDSAVATYTLLENLLTWANNEQGHINYAPKKLLLIEIVDNNIKLLKESALKKTIELSTDIGNSMKVFADYNTVDTIIRNLISNSIKYTHESGFISISAKKITGFVEVIIRDNGIGISPDEIKKIIDTDEYFSNPGTQGEKGAGIGLQLCIEFIKLNKGDYQIISEKGKGTNFIFTIPYEEK